MARDLQQFTSVLTMHRFRTQVFLGKSARFRYSYMGLTVTFVLTGRTLAKNKMETMTFVDFDICLSNGVIAKIVLRNLDLLFEGQRLESRPSHHIGEQPFACNMCEYRFDLRPSRSGERPLLAKVQMITTLFL